MGAIQGTVVDQSGGLLPGRHGHGDQPDTGLSRPTVTDETGMFRAELLPVGTYEVLAELSGFAPQRQSNVNVTVGSTVTLEIPLRVASVAETVTVTGETPVIETTKTQVSSTVNEAAVRNLPVNGRNFINFALLTPGVTTDVRTGDISFAGQRGTLNSLVVDGADNNNTFFGQTIGRTGSGRAPYQFSAAAVKEFQVNSNAYSAEYGRAGGAVINVVTRSGSNTPTGEVFEFLRDESLNAINLINKLQGRAKSIYHYNQFGGLFGGPIRRDRDFVFVNADAQRNTLPNLVFLNVPANSPTDPDTTAGLARLQPLAGELGSGAEPERVPRQDRPSVEPAESAVASLQPSELQRQELRERRPADRVAAYRRLERPDENAERQHDHGVRRKPVQRGAGSVGARSGTGRRQQRRPGSDRSAGRIDRPHHRPEHVQPPRDDDQALAGRRHADVGARPHKLRSGFDFQFDDILNYFPGNFFGAYTFSSLAAFNLNQPRGSFRRLPARARPGRRRIRTSRSIPSSSQDEWRLEPGRDDQCRLPLRPAEIREAGRSATPIRSSPPPGSTPACCRPTATTGRRASASPGARSGKKYVVRAGYGLFYGRTPSIMVGTAHSNNGINVQTITFTGSQMPDLPGHLPGAADRRGAAEAHHLHLLERVPRTRGSSRRAPGSSGR